MNKSTVDIMLHPVYCCLMNQQEYALSALPDAHPVTSEVFTQDNENANYCSYNAL